MSEHIQIREAKLAEWARTQTEKVERAEQALADADEMLKQEKMRAEASSRLAQLGEMATSIAHEINNPLAIISGYNHLIRKEMKKPEINIEKILATTDSVENTTQRITKIISGLRAYARDGSHEAMAVTPVQQIIDDTVAMIETRMRTKGVVLRLAPDMDSSIMINCRAVQLVQTMVALLNNAVDAVNEFSERWVEIGVQKAGEVVRLTVTDCGKGISADIEAKIFDPFFTTKQVGHGTGLGLSIAFGIVKDHAGKIFVDRQCPNTKFVIELPVARFDADSGKSA